MTDTGHVFVVRGRLENLDCDAVVVPTDRAFAVEPRWASVLGFADEAAFRGATQRFRPAEWAEHRWGRAGDVLSKARPTWFVDVARYGRDDAAAEIGAVTARLSAALHDIAARELEPSHGRPVPLVAVPTLGVGRGGFGEHRGAMIDRLLETCTAAVRQLRIDVAIVALNGADHSAFQARRMSGVASHDVSSTEADHARRLAAMAKNGTLALFLGAGVSMSAGLPSWTDLLEKLREDTDVDFDGVTSALDQAQLLRNALDDADPRLGERVAQIVGQEERYGLTHALLAGLGAGHVVTTNYDRLYESAARDHGVESMLVLPGDVKEPETPWLLKMHGDVERPESIVLSRSDFVGFHARSGPFGAIVQALMLTEHLLVVGSSMTDDNVLRLAHEVVAVRHAEHPFATVLSFHTTQAQQRLWERTFDYLPVGEVPGPEESDTARRARQARDARRLAIFLDALGMYASRPRHLLDERYLPLLSQEGQAAARLARDLAEVIGALPNADTGLFGEIGQTLKGHGAGER